MSEIICIICLKGLGGIVCLKGRRLHITKIKELHNTNMTWWIVRFAKRVAIWGGCWFNDKLSIRRYDLRYWICIIMLRLYCILLQLTLHNCEQC